MAHNNATLMAEAQLRQLHKPIEVRTISIQRTRWLPHLGLLQKVFDKRRVEEQNLILEPLPGRIDAVAEQVQK